MPVW